MSFEWYFFIALVPSVVLHEVAHGWVANFFGDPTAKNAHRLTLNPVRHIDPFGTLLLPALMLFAHLPAFGYAKPVPVNLSLLRRPRQQALYVGLAGPFVNIVLSLVGLVICRYSYQPYAISTTYEIGAAIGLSNLVLAVFNLLPIPPLDGSAVIERFLPNRHRERYYYYRARALPLVMAFVIISEYVFHFGASAFSGLENWWLNLAS